MNSTICFIRGKLKINKIRKYLKKVVIGDFSDIINLYGIKCNGKCSFIGVKIKTTL